jgi:imidazolonepropionase-like amidohydrolase
VLRAFLPPDQRAAFSTNFTRGIHVPDVQSPEGLRLIALLKEHGTILDPTLALTEWLAHAVATPGRQIEPGIDHVAPALRDQLEQSGVLAENVTAANAYFGACLDAVRALHAAGVPIVAGTDMAVPGYSLHRELELYVKAGFTPMEAIQAATIVPARAMGLGDEAGSLAVHKRADLLIVDGDPLSSIAELRRVETVIMDGHVYHPGPLLTSVGFTP